MTAPFSQDPTAGVKPARKVRKSPTIKVKGTVSVGQELKLKQSPAPVETNSNGMAIKNWMGSRIDYRLVRAPRSENTNEYPELEIKDDGLVTGFGIFGAPGTGKSYLVLRILHKMLEEVQPVPEKKFGGLILDPKAGLLEDVAGIWEQLGPHRADDLIIIKPDLLNDPSKLEALGVDPQRHPRGLNVIDCALSPTELGRMLVLAAQSAGVSAKEPFWFLAWSNLFSAALTLLEYTEVHVPTIRVLLDHILLPHPDGQEVTSGGKGGAKRRQRGIEVLAARIRRDMPKFVDDAHESLRLPKEQLKADFGAAIAAIESFFQADYVPTLEAFITNAFGGFNQYKFWSLSKGSRRTSVKYGVGRGRPSLFDQIIEEGKVVLVSVGPEDPAMGKVLCTLIKCLFQQSVMSRLERHSSGKIKNFARPVFIACDEYAEIASEVPGQPMGDGRFFSLSRQNGCMGLLATQSIHTLENSSLAESWKSIFSNLAAKIFMGAADNETAEQACNLAGQLDWELTSTTESYGKDASFSHQRSFEQRPELTPYVLTHVLKRGQAALIGSLDGRFTPPELRFFQVPEKQEGSGTSSAGEPETGERKWKWKS